MTQKEKKQTLAEKMNSPEVLAKVKEIVDYCIEHKLNAELVGCWVWVSFEEKPDAETLQDLKAAGFRWSPRRKKWAHNCGVKTASAKASNPWQKYDHRVINGRVAS